MINIKTQILIISIIISLYCCIGFAVADDSVARNRIVVYPYSEPKVGFQFEDFLIFLETNTGNLIDEIEPIESIEIECLPKKLNKPFLSHKNMKEIWDVSPRIIEILSGTITENPKKSGYTILTIIYSDILSQINKRKQLSLMEDSANHTTREFLSYHHIVLLYSLAINAKAQQKPSWQIVSLLSKAQEISLRLELDSMNGPIVKKLIELISKELKLQEQISQ